MAQPHHTEHSLLSRYLLPPSSLPTIVPFKDFLAQHKSSSDPATAQALKKLYQDLQFQRNLDIDTVRLNIDRECLKGGVLKAKLRRRVRDELGEEGQGRKRKRGNEEREESVYISESEDAIQGERGEYDSLNDPRERKIDGKFIGPNGAVPPSTTTIYHTTSSLLQAMQGSIDDLEKKISQLDQESDQVVGEMKETIGALSDLKYGKFTRVSAEDTGDAGAIEGQVIEALRELVKATNRKSTQARKGNSGG